MRTEDKATEAPALDPSFEELDLPRAPFPQAPSASRLIGATFVLAWLAVIYFLLDRGALALMNLWFLDSIGLRSVFWTNFKAGLILFAVPAVLFPVATTVPALLHRASRVARRRALAVGVLVGLVSGYLLARSFRDYLLFFGGKSFGETDPVFNLDIGFYVFKIPALWETWTLLTVGGVAALAASITFAYVTRPLRRLPVGMNRLLGVVATVSTRCTLVIVGYLGLLLAAAVWLTRYNVPIRDNISSQVWAGAEFLDVTGFFSSVNAITVEMLAVVFMSFGAVLTLRALRHSVETGDPGWRQRVAAWGLLLVFLPGAGLDLAFRSFVALRDQTQVVPNEPLIQLAYIQRHIDATNKAWGMDDIEVVPFVPNGPKDPMPRLHELLEHPTVRNTPLWPGWAAYLEDLQDPQHVNRLHLLEGATKIYAPAQEAFWQQQKLRVYYDIRDVDTTRYFIDGEPTLFANAIRELPLDDPQPWLDLWGQRNLLFTHGFGMVMAPLGQATGEGSPRYAAYNIPVETTFPELEQANPAVYYGEATGPVLAFSNAKDLKELDRPTDEGRAEVEYPTSERAGVKMDSLLKRAVLGWKSGNLLSTLFSDLIVKGTRAHYFRPPLERLDHIAPFLWLDSDPYGVLGGGRIHWMANGITTADRYPYAMRGELGDTSDVRTPNPRGFRLVNYAQDSVKATIDTYTGQVSLYKWKDEPVVETWESIYPAMFKPKSQMPDDLREQVQYPVNLFHVQFDDLYTYYHMLDALTFFNVEDLWDDSDEVLGPMIDQGDERAEGEQITFSIEPYYWLAKADGKPMPRASRPYQFSLSMSLTPEDTNNLRAIVTAYMDRDDYGRINILQVPKGYFFMGPEQADSAIDQDDFMGQQITLWIRQGVDVIRGHTTPLVVGNELIYVEPIFIRSEQEPVPQLKRVAVVWRNVVAVGVNLQDALNSAIDGPLPHYAVRRGPEVGGEPHGGAAAAEEAQGVSPEEAAAHRGVDAERTGQSEP